AWTPTRTPRCSTTSGSRATHRGSCGREHDPRPSVRAAVTGASGLLGRRLVRALRDRGDDVVAVARGALPPADADVTFHLAAQTTVPAAREDPVGTFEANVALAWRVLAASRRSVLASSDQVYGPRAPVPTAETAPL